MGKNLKFRGIYRHTVDHKGRVAIPSSFRKMLLPEDGVLVLTKGYDGEIEVHPVSEWEEFEEKVLLSLSYSKRPARRFLRRRAGFATEVEMDGQGRIILPRVLREYAEIEDEVIIIGVVNYFEIWNPKKFEEFMKESEEYAEEDAENLENYMRR